ncbi:inositol monophosphatase [Candidatus Woesearchaeota archaeon]|nr:inositol monophosphatase [Candidatus Woesearchaeota archaeon]
MKSLMLKAAKSAGSVVLKNYNNIGKIKFKTPRDLVTKVDILSEKTIIEIIRKKFPEHSFITEESGAIDKKSRYTWIIDPIDGTTNFVAKIPQFAVSIALAKNNKIIMGAVYNPLTKEMFFAEKGKGSYLNNKRLFVSKKSRLKDCILAFSAPTDIRLGRKTFSILRKNHGTFRALRNLGSAALNMCYIANGKFDLYFSLRIRPWDVAAAKLVVEEAGGKVSCIKGKEWLIRHKKIAASNKIMHNQFIKLLR